MSLFPPLLLLHLRALAGLINLRNRPTSPLELRRVGPQGFSFPRGIVSNSRSSKSRSSGSGSGSSGGSSSTRRPRAASVTAEERSVSADAQLSSSGGSSGSSRGGGSAAYFLAAAEPVRRGRGRPKGGSTLVQLEAADGWAVDLDRLIDGLKGPAAPAETNAGPRRGRGRPNGAMTRGRPMDPSAEAFLHGKGVDTVAVVAALPVRASKLTLEQVQASLGPLPASLFRMPACSKRAAGFPSASTLWLLDCSRVDRW